MPRRALILWFFSPVIVSAADATLHPELEQVQAFAPIVWLAHDERLHPMLPHAFAFDDIDNDGDGRKDLEDACEVNLEWVHDPVRPCPRQRIGEVGDLISFYQRRIEGPVPPPRVLYDGPRLFSEPWRRLRRKAAAPLEPGSLSEAVCGQLPPVAEGPPCPSLFEEAPEEKRAYQQAPVVLERQPRIEGRSWVFTRTERDRLEPHVYEVRVDEGGKLEVYRDPQYVLQFWLYYIYDEGANSHRHDSEHVFVFLDRVARGGDAIYQVRAVVGAGHEIHAANNILVASPYKDGQKTGMLPESLPAHMPILVELGKHASAPDRHLDGRFDFGMDANLFAEAVWGTRDVQSANLGKIKINRFQPWYSFPRRTRDILVERTSWCGRPSRAAYEADHEDRLPRLDDRIRCHDPVRAREENRKRASVHRAYVLFPLADMERLHELVADDGGLPPDAHKKKVQQFLEEHSPCFWDERRSAVPLSDEAFVEMKRWARGGESKHLSRRDPWTHGDYKDPSNIFKLFLYRHVGFGVTAKWEAGNPVKGVTARVADVRLPWLGRQLHDSTLEARLTFEHLNLDPFDFDPQPEVFDAGLVYHAFRGRYVGWYVGLHYRFWHPDDKPAEPWALRFSGGISVGLPSFKPWRNASLYIQAGVVADPFRHKVNGGTSDAPVVTRLNDPVAVQLGATLSFGFFNPRSPLQY